MKVKNVLILIEYAKYKFTETDEKIAGYFTSLGETKSISDLAEKIGVSCASITRFCKKLGLQNYKEFIFLYQEQIDLAKTGQGTELNGVHYALLDEFEKRFSLPRIQNINALIHHHKIIHVFGLGFSALAGADFKFRFTRLGKFIECVSDSDSMKMMTKIIPSDGLVIFFSVKGMNADMIACASDLKQKGVNVVCITANPNSPMIEHCRYVFFTSPLDGYESNGLISGQFPLLIAIDHLYFQYVKVHKEQIQHWVATEQLFMKEEC